MVSMLMLLIYVIIKFDLFSCYFCIAVLVVIEPAPAIIIVVIIITTIINIFFTTWRCYVCSDIQ